MDKTERKILLTELGMLVGKHKKGPLKAALKGTFTSGPRDNHLEKIRQTLDTEILRHLRERGIDTDPLCDRMDQAWQEAYKRLGYYLSPRPHRMRRSFRGKTLTGTLFTAPLFRTPALVTLPLKKIGREWASISIMWSEYMDDVQGLASHAIDALFTQAEETPAVKAQKKAG